MLGLDRATRLQFKQRSDMTCHCFRNIDPPGRAICLHERCRIHSITPDVEGELPLPDHAGNNRTGMKPDRNSSAGNRIFSRKAFMRSMAI